MRAKLGAVENYLPINELKDSATLLSEIKGISYQYNGHRNLYLALDDAKSKYYAYYQKEHDTNTLHFNKFRALVEVVEHHGGNSVNDGVLIDLEKKNAPQ